MKKLEQLVVNNAVLNAIEKMNELSSNERVLRVRPLRTCSAKVIETEHYYILQSYNTKIAFIEKESDTIYDVLRYVYGFTNTSSQHISKFKKDYGRGKWGCHFELTYRDI